MSDSGIKVLKNNAKLGTKDLRDFVLNSDLVLLKIHKQGSFKVRALIGEGTVTIRYDDLGYRPIVLVYTQRINQDGTTDTDFSFGDWRYDGATQQGEQTVKIYNDHFDLRFYDTDPDIPAAVDIFGYFYVFKEEVRS